MHKHRDDVAGVPFLFLTPTRRPVSRPSSRASSHSARLLPIRPETPSSAPSSPLAMVFRRPHTPATSPLGTAPGVTSYINAHGGNDSTHSSPVLAHAQATYAHAQFAASLPSSPMSSPRLLSAKASEFKPIPRPLSAASSNPASLSALRDSSPSPDLWSHGSPRTSSNLAIAAPLLPEERLLPRSLTPSSSLRRSSTTEEDEEEDDPFDPFSSKTAPRSFHSITISDFDAPWSNSSNSTSSLSPEDMRTLDEQARFQQHPYDQDRLLDEVNTAQIDADAAAMLTDGMTPFDVLSSVFGSTLAPSELEDALATNGYEFERAMAWLVDRALPVAPPQTPQIRLQQMGGRVTLVSRDRGGGPTRGGYQDGTSPPGVSGRGTIPRYVNGRPVTGGNRVCRYFVAGECLRADCRFR
jgi:hypothetical protein